MIVKKEQLEKVKEIYDKYRLFIYPGVISLACIILIVTVIYPQIRSYLSDQDTAKNLTDKSQILEAKAAELSNIDGTDLNRKLNLATSALPTDKDYGSIIGLVQRIAAESGVTITSLALAASAGEKATGFSIRLDVTGTNLTINNLIQNIEKSPRVMKVLSIETSSSAASGTVTAGLVINALYVPAPGSLGSVESELPKFSAKDEEILATLANSSLAETVPVTPSEPGTGVSTEPTGPLLPRGKSNPFQ